MDINDKIKKLIYFEDDIRILSQQKYEAEWRVCRLKEEIEDKHNILYYRGFVGSIEIADDIYFGKLLGIKDLVTYESPNTDIESLRSVFEDAVNDYIEVLEELDKYELVERGSYFEKT